MMRRGWIIWLAAVMLLLAIAFDGGDQLDLLDARYAMDRD